MSNQLPRRVPVTSTAHTSMRPSCRETDDSGQAAGNDAPPSSAHFAQPPTNDSTSATPLFATVTRLIVCGVRVTDVSAAPAEREVWPSSALRLSTRLYQPRQVWSNQLPRTVPVLSMAQTSSWLGPRLTAVMVARGEKVAPASVYQPRQVWSNQLPRTVPVLSMAQTSSWLGPRLTAVMAAPGEKVAPASVYQPRQVWSNQLPRTVPVLSMAQTSSCSGPRLAEATPAPAGKVEPANVYQPRQVWSNQLPRTVPVLSMAQTSSCSGPRLAEATPAPAGNVAPPNVYQPRHGSRRSRA